MAKAPPSAREPDAPVAPRARRRRGLTLIEVVIALAVLAVLSTLALPSMSRLLARQRVQTAAELLAADISDARHEAARRGSALHLSSSRSNAGDWCWAVTTTPGCGCGQTAVCRLKQVRAADHPGVSALALPTLTLRPDGQAESVASALFAAGDARVSVMVSLLGRARVCDPDGLSRKLPRC